MPIRLKREATVTSLIARIDAGSPASMNDAQILQYAAQFLMLDKVIATDPMVADAAALLSVTTATELEDMLIQEDTHDAFDAAINDADIRAELFANTVARAAIVGSTRAVQRLTTSGTFDAFLANSNMRTSLFGSTTALGPLILGFTTLRAFLLGTPTAGNLTLALSDTSMRTAMYADATTRTELLASSTMMDTLWGITAARDAAFNDATMRAAVLASTNAFTRLLANATARQAAWANANMPAAIAGSTAALAIIDDTQAHMDEALSSTYSAMRSASITTATSRGVIVASATMRRCANVAGFMAAALAGTFLTAWRASSVLTARELPTETTTDANLTASSIISGYEEWKAADASTSSEWIAGTAPPAWLKYDFGSGKSINVHQLVVLQAGGNRKPNAWVLEGSNDNSAWTSVGSGNMANNTTQQLFTIAHSAGYRYLRWTVNSEHGGSQPGIADFDIKGFEIQ